MPLRSVAVYTGETAPARALAQCVAQAFAGYNGWEWLMGEHVAAPCSSWLLERQISKMLTSKPAVAYAVPVTCDGEPVGMAAVAFLIRCPARAPPPPPPSFREQAALVWTLGPRIALRLNAFNAAVGRLHEQDAAADGEHYMISFVGVLPHMQGRGLASQVVTAMLATADAERRPCYLFTANDRNEAWYARHGFVTRSRRSMGAITAGAHAGEEMVVRSMLRPAARRTSVRL